MKNYIKLLALLILTSCSTTKQLKTGSQISKDGMLVAQKGIDTYTLLQQQKDIDRSQQDMILILTAPNPAAVHFSDSTGNTIAIQIAPRINAYKSLIAAYQAFGRLTGNDNSADTKTAADALTASYNSVKQLPDLSSGVMSLISTGGTYIMQAIQSGSMKKHNEALSQLTKIYLDLWNSEAPTWDRYIDFVYDTYGRQLRTIPAKNYDMTKVKAGVADQPYTGDAISLALYQEKQYVTVIQQKNTLKKQLADFGKLLTLLNQAHIEFSKDQADTTAAASTLINIETLLQTK